MLTPTPLDIGALYGSFARRLERIVRLDVRASEPVVEDACQFAWSRLIDHTTRIRRDEAVLAWLATTAIREARRLARRQALELSFDEAREPSAPNPGPHELVEYRERLRLIERLPERQQRLVWLHALGLSYAEMAISTGCTPRTVERQLLRAKHRVRALARRDRIPTSHAGSWPPKTASPTAGSASRCAGSSRPSATAVS